jgi:hypothetical protein
MNIDFQHEYDIVIAGAGVAGVAAALEAARSGFKTALVEKTVFFGGLATTGMVNIYLPLDDGAGRQVIYGIAEELLHLSLKYGPGEVPKGWRKDAPRTPGKAAPRYLAAFSPAAFILALDEVLQSAGVTLWLDTLACVPVIEGQRIKGVEVENKGGRGRLLAQVVIDATGDADLVYRAGSPCVEQDNWMSLWMQQLSKTGLEKALHSQDPEALLKATCFRVGATDTGAGHPEGMPKFYGATGEQVTQFVLEGRRLLREYYQRQEEDRSEQFPMTLPAMAQYRTTRRITGREGMQDGQDHLPRATSIGLTCDWRKPGPIWEIPYGALLPAGVTGILAAGRCIDSSGDAWQVTRVIPPAALTGQAAGVAAGLAVRQGTTPEKIEAAEVQKAMRKRGIPIHIEEL